MSAIPSNYTAPAAVSAMPRVDSAENAQRLASVEALGDIIMSNDPKVSTDQKLEAFNSLSHLVGKAWRDEGAQEAIAKASWLKTESPLAKRINDVGNRYQNAGMAEGRAAQARGGDEEWTGGNPIAAFSKFSEDDQKVLMVALGLDTQYGSVKEAYDDFQRQSDEAVARYQASKQKTSVKVSLSDEAKALLGPESVANISGSKAEQALARLTADGPRTDKGSVALSMLQKASEARAQAKADETTADATPPAETPQAPGKDRALQDKRGFYYRSGDKVDKNA